MAQFEYIEEVSTEGDSCEERQAELCKIKCSSLKYKTQLCKSFSEMGYCNYGNKCRFAHGKYELVESSRGKKKHIKCKGFWGSYMCGYGVRCQFGHCEEQQNRNERQMILLLAQAAFGSCVESDFYA